MFSTPQNGPNAPLQAGFAHRVRVQPHFGGFWPVHVHQKGVKMVKNGSKMTFSKTDTGPFGVSLELFLARSEASLSRFDLLRVVCFTYPQCALQTMHALQQEVNGGQMVPYQKERNTPPKGPVSFLEKVIFDPFSVDTHRGQNPPKCG